MADDKELEKWIKRGQILLSVLGGGGIIGVLITFSAFELCKRIFLTIAIIVGTLALIIFSRLLLKTKSREALELPSSTASSPFKYLAKNARLLLVSEIVLVLTCVLGSFFFVFPESLGTLSLCQTPEPCSITNLGWIDFPGAESTINASPVIGSKCALEISFDLKEQGWAAVYKKLEPNQLLQTQGIRFSYSGTGAANTLELKLFEIDANGDEILFYAEWDGATSTAGKSIIQEVDYSELICQPSQGKCPTGATIIKPELVDRIDFSVSNRSGQLPGSGEVTIEWIQIIP